MIIISLFMIPFLLVPFVYDGIAKKREEFIRYRRGTYIFLELMNIAYYISFVTLSPFMYMPHGWSDLGPSNLKVLLPFTIGFVTLELCSLMDIKSGKFMLLPLLVSLVLALFVSDPGSNILLNLIRCISVNSQYVLMSVVFMALILLFSVVLRAYSLGDAFLYILSFICLYRICFELGFLLSFVLMLMSLLLFAGYGIIRLMKNLDGQILKKRCPFTVYIFIGYICSASYFMLASV